MERLKPLNDFIFKKLFGEKDDEPVLIAFLTREYSNHERANMISSAEERGEQRGILQGKLEVARRLLLSNVDIDIIIASTELTREQIERIKKEI